MQQPPQQQQQPQDQDSSNAIVVGVVVESEEGVSDVVGGGAAGKADAAEAAEAAAAAGAGARVAEGAEVGAPLPRTETHPKQQQQQRAASFRPLEASLPAAGAEPPGQPYTVVGGDSILSICQAHGISVEDFKAWNGLTTDLIYPGRVLAVTPGGGAAAVVATAFPTEEEEGAPSTSSTARAVQRTTTQAASQPPALSYASVAARGSALEPGAPAETQAAATSVTPGATAEGAASPARSGGARSTPVLAGVSSAAALRNAEPATAAGSGVAVTGGPKRAALLDEDTYELVDRVFFGGLSHALVQTLTVVAQRAPALQPQVQVRGRGRGQRRGRGRQGGRVGCCRSVGRMISILF